jgi:hypothetical protein
VTYAFNGTTDLAAIAGVAVTNLASFNGSLSYDTEAQLISSTPSSARYFDPNASLVIGYDNVGFKSSGGLTLSLNRIDLPVFKFSSLTFASTSVEAIGTNEPIASMILGFKRPAEHGDPRVDQRHSGWDFHDRVAEFCALTV